MLTLTTSKQVNIFIGHHNLLGTIHESRFIAAIRSFEIKKAGPFLK
jgi:hypothetical protein